MFKRIAVSFSLSLLVAVALLPDRLLHAVWFNPRGVALGTALGGWYGGGLGYGTGWGGYYGGGTAAGNYMQGMSEVIRSQGQYNKDTTEAYINYEEARSKYIDNKKKWTESYFAMREKNQAEQAEKRERSRPSKQALDQAARSGVPRALSAEDFDPVTGRVDWPDILEGSDYDVPRKEIDQLLELRAQTSGGDTSSRIQRLVQTMITTLKSQIQQVPTHDYIVARKFLDSLAFAVRS